MKAVMSADGRVPVGLFDFDSYWEIVEVVSDVLGLSRDEVQERLFHEAVETGWNTSQAASEFGITPHVYDERMEEFYSRSHSFVFELLISHLDRYCQEIDRRVAESIETYFSVPKDVQLLALGDGIGTDSLRFALAGYRVTYFDFKGHSYHLAQRRFQRQGVQDQIRMLHRLDRIPTETFDVVICREVLEHVPDLLTVIDNIWNYSKQGGMAVITESFGRIEPAFPSHLACNQQYNGQTERLFVQAGFRLLKVFPGCRPMVFSKTDKTDRARFETLVPPVREYPIRKFVTRLGKHVLRLIRF